MNDEAAIGRFRGAWTLVEASVLYSQVGSNDRLFELATANGGPFRERYAPAGLPLVLVVGRFQMRNIGDWAGGEEKADGFDEPPTRIGDFTMKLRQHESVLEGAKGIELVADCRISPAF